MKFTFILLFTLLNPLISDTKKDVVFYLTLTSKEVIEKNRKITGLKEVIDYDIKDTKNGFIRYSIKGIEGFSEYTIWKKKNGTVLAGEINYSCGPACMISGIHFYEIKEQIFKDITETIYPKSKIEELYKKKLDHIQAKGASGSETLWISLPRKGLDIQIGINQDPTNPDEKLIPIATLKWNETNFTLKSN
jgi:hypothetical protein